MEKAKKKETLTPEERLQAALVPDWEQPYKVPENWCWVNLLASFENFTGSKKKIPKKEYLKDGKIAVIDQGQNLIGGYTNNKEMIFPGNLPVIIFGDHTRCIKYIDFPFVQGADGVKVLKPKRFFDTKAFYYAFQTIDIPNMGYRRHFPLFDQYAIPVPPLPEQQRIVDRIESLFAKLDDAKQKAQDALDSFETRKAAILHKAFTGELTARWRKEHEYDLNWEEHTIGDLFIHTTGKALKRGNTTGTLHKYITTSNLYWGKFDFSEVREMYFTDKELEKCTAKKGDLLVCNGGDVGRSAVWNYDFDICLQNHISKLRPKNEKINVWFFYYFFMNSKNKGYINGRGIGISSLSAKNLLSIKVLLPTLLEQTEIVRILDDLIAKEQQSKETAEAVLEQIDLIKKSTLARAFRGELGTNDPTEESAVELLKKY